MEAGFFATFSKPSEIAHTCPLRHETSRGLLPFLRQFATSTKSAPCDFLESGSRFRLVPSTRKLCRLCRAAAVKPDGIIRYDESFVSWMGDSPMAPELWRTEKVAERRKPSGLSATFHAKPGGLRRFATVVWLFQQPVSLL
jgi:hypothetical protein